MGLGYKNQQSRTIGTAKENSSLKHLGQAKRLSFKIKGMGDRVFQVEPAVIKDLSDPVNLGMRFFKGLQQCQINFDENKLKIGRESTEFIKVLRRPKGNQTAKLERAPGRPPDTQGQAVTVVATQNCKLAQHTVTMVTVKAKAGQEAQWENFRGQNVLFEGRQGICALYEWPGRVALINHRTQAIYLKENAELGSINQVEQTNPQEAPPTCKNVKAPTTCKISKARQQELHKELGLDTNKILQQFPDLLRRTKELVNRFSHIFSSPERQTGTTDLMEFDVEVEEDARPVKSKLRPLNPKQRESLREQLDTWEKEKVIEPTNSPWASPLVPVLKKDGTTRWAIDFRALNRVTVADSFPLPNVQENLERLQGARVFSTLDAAAAYMTIPTSQRSRPYLAFITPFGTYTFLKMPFGARNSGSCYARFVEKCILKLRSPFILAYIDDVIVATPELEQHLLELEKVFEVHAEAGICLKAKKTFLFQSEVEYLGYVVSEKGIQMKQSFIQNVLKWPKPTTRKQLATFLGFVGYYREFIPEFSELTNEMNAQKSTKTTEPLQWTAEIERKFQLLKDKFKVAPIRAYPQYHTSEKFILTTDFSSHNVGAILSQKQNGVERMISAAGRKTTSYEANYPSHKGELAAIIFGLRKFEHILRFKKFLIRTDASSLRFLNKLKNPRGIMARWLGLVQSYEFDIDHLPGKRNAAADALSRANHLGAPTSEEEEEEAELVEALKLMDEVVQGTTREALKREQKVDPILSQVRKWVSRKEKPSKEELKGKSEDLRVYVQNFESLILSDEVLYVKHKPNNEGEDRLRIAVPHNSREIAFYWAHCHPTAGHFGETATVLRAQKYFYYPGLVQDLRLKTKQCSTCLAKVTSTNRKDASHVPRQPGFPGECISIDLVGPLPLTHKNEKYILTVEDEFTRFVKAYPLQNKEAATIARVLIDHYISTFGVPLKLHSDNAKEFIGEIFKHLCDRLQIKKTTTPTYNPQSNPVERFHKSLNQMMRIFLEREDTEWSRYLGIASLAYNTKVNQTTGVTPFQAMMGREARLPVDLIIAPPDVHYDKPTDFITSVVARFQRIYEYMRQKQQGTIRRNAQLYSGKDANFQVGAKVWYLCPRQVPGKPTKLTDSWLGPYTIEQKVSQVLYRIRLGQNRPSIVVHATRLILCDPQSVQTGKSRTPNSIRVDDGGDEYAEEVQGSHQPAGPELGIPIHFPAAVPPMVDLTHQETRAPPSRGAPDIPPPAAITEEASMPPAATPVTYPEEVTLDQPAIFLEPEDVVMHDGPKKRSNEDTTSPREPKIRIRKKKVFFKRALDSSSEDNQATKLGRYIDTSSADESDVNTIRPITVGLKVGSSIPRRTTAGAAAYDFTAAETRDIKPGCIETIPLNVSLDIPQGVYLQLLSRSGLAQKHIHVLGGVIDPDFKQEIKVILHNTSKDNFKVRKKQRVCQGVFLPTIQVQFQNHNDPEIWNNHSHAGFGSTDILQN